MQTSVLHNYFPNCDVVLHLGAHRTGTTALQTQLDVAALASTKRIALTPPRQGKRTTENLRDAFTEFRKLRKNPWRLDLRFRLQKTLRALVTDQDADTLIVSDEMFLGPIFDQHGDGIYPDAATWLGDCAAFLGKDADQIHLVVRPYAAFLTSAYTMRAVYARGIGGLNQYRDGFLRCKRGWPDVVADIRATFPDATLRIWRFPENLINDNLFNALTGLTKAPPIGASRNGSVSDAGVNYALSHKTDPDYDPDTVVAQFSEGTPFVAFTATQTAQLNERYAADLVKLSNTCKIETGTLPEGNTR